MFVADVVCFCSGTLIRTARGDVAVEDLAVGDLAVTASGEHCPICWIGHRTLDCIRHPEPAAAMPIRIRAHALGENRPTRDLRVSPGHSIALDLLGEVLVPAHALVNGATIIQEAVDEVTYWHVELDSHDLLLANGQPAESYLDMGNRRFFGEATADPTLGPDAPAERTHVDFCRPFHADDAVAAFARQRLRARAVALGWSLQPPPSDHLHLVVDGAVVQPDVDGLTARFVVPAAAREVWLVSSACVPALTLADNRDGRSLGVSLSDLTIDDGLAPRRTVALDDARLTEGFNAVERNETGLWRWTNGRARLPADLWVGCRGQFFLRLILSTEALLCWVAPERAEREDVAAEPAALDRHLRLVEAAA